MIYWEHAHPKITYLTLHNFEFTLLLSFCIMSNSQPSNTFTIISAQINRFLKPFLCYSQYIRIICTNFQAIIADYFFSTERNRVLHIFTYRSACRALLLALGKETRLATIAMRLNRAEAVDKELPAGEIGAK